MADTTKTYENIFIKKNAAGDREYIKVPYAILADPPTIPDVSGFMPKSGGTFTGEVTFNKKINLGQGDANCLYLGADGRLNGPENKTLFGLVSGATTFGHQAYSLHFRGSTTRPQYTTDGSNYKDLALKSDIPADYVKYTTQTLTDAQKLQSRSNIGAGTSNFSGNYNDLANKPTIPTDFDKLTRIQKKAYTGGDNTVKYFKLASFPVYNSGGNYASFIITGRMGGWQDDNMSFVNMILYNRNGEGGGYINVANSAFFNLCDIVMYREEDGTSTAYLKVKSYYTFDINVNTYQATNVYTGTDDTPTGTLKWTASEQADRLAVSDGKAYINGFTMPKQVKINGTAYNPDANAVIDLGTVLTSAPSNMVTTDTIQTISGAKTFSKNIAAPNFNSRFTLQSVPYGTAIGSNANLNTIDYLKVGNYYCGADATVVTQTNVPTRNAYMMTVYSPLTTTVDNESTDKWVYRVRKLMTYQSDEYIQSVYSGSTPGEFTYGPWEKVAHTSDIPTVNNGSLIFHTALVDNYATFTANQSGSTVLTIDVDAINETNKEYSLAIGGVTRGASANGTYSVALGSNAQAKYTGTVKIGYGITPSSQSVTQINVGSYTSAGRALYLGAGRSGFTYMNAAGSSWTSASDIRDKTDIEEIDHALDFIKKLKPITYVMNDRERYLIRDEDDNPILDENGKQQYDIEAHKRGDKKKHRRFAGLSAQDTYQAMLDCYNNDTNYAQIVDNNKFDHPDDEYLEQYSMSYERLVPFLIKAVQEQQEQIEQLRSKLGE